MAALVKPVPQFDRGDLVRWTSWGRGRQVHHVGVVVLSVPAGIPVGALLPNLAERYSLRSMRPMPGNRPDRSYLVAVTEGGDRGKARLHWPHASLLRPYTAVSS